MVKVKYKNFKHSDTTHDNTTVQARHVEAIYEGMSDGMGEASSGEYVPVYDHFSASMASV